MIGNQSAPRVLVIVPAHNEAPRIAAVVCGVRMALPAADIAVINDASTDETAAQAREVGALVLPHPVNLGYGAALETGYLHALESGYNYVLQMDGDGQHLAEELPKLLAPLAAGEADLVIGSRYLAGGQYRAPLPRRMGQLFFRALVWLLTRRRLTDPTSGFQGLNRDALRFMVSGIFPPDYPDADVLTMTAKAGLRLMEVPVRMATREGGVSMHSGLKPLYYMMKMLLALFVVWLSRARWAQWRSEHPRAVQGGP